MGEGEPGLAPKVEFGTDANRTRELGAELLAYVTRGSGADEAFLQHLFQGVVGILGQTSSATADVASMVKDGRGNFDSDVAPGPGPGAKAFGPGLGPQGSG